jgi:hypothetical protein
MRKHLEITPNLEPLFGTRDENLRLMEDALQARIDLQSDAVLVEGSQDAITRVERIFQDYEALRKQGINLQNGELNGMLRLVVADPSVTLKSLAESGKQRSAGIKRMVQRGHGQDVSGRRHGRGSAAGQKGEPDCAGAACRGSRRAAGLSAGHAAGEGGSIPASAVRRAVRPD